jgi:succinyl-CoA:acetate CoA-transferase
MKSEIDRRIRNKDLLQRVMSASDAASFIKDGMLVGTVGTTTSGSPATVLESLAERGRRGEKLQVSLCASGPPGHAVDGVLAEAGILRRRLGQQSNLVLRNAVNRGFIKFSDYPMGKFPERVRAGLFGNIDLALIEAAGITEDGCIIPSTCVLDAPSYVLSAKAVIVEINSFCPLEMEGIHDIYVPERPPNRKPIPIMQAGDRIGYPWLPPCKDKIVAITESYVQYVSGEPLVLDEDSKAIAQHLLAFFRQEIQQGKLPKNLLPIEIGLGATADAALKLLAASEFEGLAIYSAVLGDGILDLIDSGKLTAASGTGMYLSSEGYKRFFRNLEKYKKQVILRPVDIADSPEVIQRLGVIALNGAVEVDIYGHVNGTHTTDGLLSGVGGAGEFAQNGFLSIFLLPSARKGGGISTVVPMALHVDFSEHAVDVIVTEQGLADLRCLDPIERAHTIIDNCAHPNFRSELKDYLNKAVAEKLGHEPHLLNKALSFHQRLERRGTML